MLSFHVLTLFPELLMSAVDCSMVKRAREKRIIDVHFWNIRDQCTDKHRKADDAPYGGGSGLVMKVAPIIATLERVKAEHNVDRVVLLSASGHQFDQKKANELSQLKELVLVCGHYEGIDDRVGAFVDEELSIGDFVLTGGEPAALVIIDAVCRLVPGVLGNTASAVSESHTGDPLLEHPQFTRPLEFCGMRVPDVLISGHHAEIERWRRKESIRRTLVRRPELWQKHEATATDVVLFNEVKAELVSLQSAGTPDQMGAHPPSRSDSDHNPLFSDPDPSETINK